MNMLFILGGQGTEKSFVVTTYLLQREPKSLLTEHLKSAGLGKLIAYFTV